MNACKIDEVRKKSIPTQVLTIAQRVKLAGQGRLLELNLGGWSNKLTFIEHRLCARHYSKHFTHAN